MLNTVEWSSVLRIGAQPYAVLPSLAQTGKCCSLMLNTAENFSVLLNTAQYFSVLVRPSQYAPTLDGCMARGLWGDAPDAQKFVGALRRPTQEKGGQPSKLLNQASMLKCFYHTRKINWEFPVDHEKIDYTIRERPDDHVDSELQ